MDRIHREARLDRLAQCPTGHDTRHYYKWLDEIDELTKQNAKLLEALKAGYPFVKAHVGALHMMDGFNPQEREEDKLVLKIEQAIAEAEGQS